jgi:oligosaccharide repeat unit polymerase
MANKGKLLKVLILFFGVIGLLAVIQNWLVLLKEFGSIEGVLLNASLVYRMRIERSIEGQIPYLFTFSYVAMFFAAVYSASRNKISILTIIPFAGVILKEVSQSSRAGLLNSFFLFLSTFLIYRYFYQLKEKVIFSNRKIVMGFIVIALLLYLSTTLIRVTRITNEKFKGATTELSEMEANAIISPSIYLYFSGQIGTLNKVIKCEERSYLFAEKTLTMFYGTIAKFKLVKRPKDHDKGYFIPVWINTGTYLREIFMDYGFLGLIIVPFILGFLCTLYWYKFFETGSLLHLMILSHLYVIVGFSFVIFVVRLSTWVLPIVILTLVIYIIENRNRKSLNQNRY